MRLAAAISILLPLTGGGCALLLGIDGDFTEEPGGPASGGSMPAGGSGGTGTASGGAGAAGGEEGGEGGAGLSGPIEGTRLYYDLAPDGSFDDVREEDYATGDHVIEAYIYDNGTWSAPYPGSGTDSGAFTIPGVPPGPYLLHIDYEHYWMSNRSGIDLASYSTARFDAVTTTNEPMVHFQVSNMTAWKDGDVFQFVSPTTQGYGFVDDPSKFNPMLGVGQTDIDAVSLWSQVTSPPQVIETTDPVTFFHLGTAGADLYETIVDYAADISFEVEDMPATYDVAVTFEHVSHNQTQHLHVDIAAFEAVAAASAPIPEIRPVYVARDVHPAPLSLAGTLIGTPDLFLDSLPQGEPDSNTTYVFGNPFPADWDQFVAIGNNILVTHQLPGGSQAVRGYTATRVWVYPDDLILSGLIAPQVAPPTAVVVDGLDFFTGGPLATSTPAVSWTAPAKGSPSIYLLQAFPVTLEPFGSTVVHKETPSWFWTDGANTTIQVPPGMLAPGTHYVLQLTATECSACDYPTRPSAVPLPIFESNVVSQIFETPP